MCVRGCKPKIQKGEADFRFSFFIGSPLMICYPIWLRNVCGIRTGIRYRSRYNRQIELEIWWILKINRHVRLPIGAVSNRTE